MMDAAPAEHDECADAVLLWIMGVHAGNAIAWRKFATRDAATESWASTRSSRVLFDPSGAPVNFFTARHDPEGLGVALVLLAFERGCCRQPDAPAALEALRSGGAPFVPPERPAAVRAALRAVVRLAFGRASVAYFSAGPHRRRSLCYFDAARFPGVAGHVALTLDDAPCRFGRQGSMLPRVRELLRRHAARATLMLVGGYARGHEEDLAGLLGEGHELGNHCMQDRAYHADGAGAFALAVEECCGVIRGLQRRAGVAEGVRWFRAPHGKYTEAMGRVLAGKGLVNVMCDAYACCPVIQDGDFIGRTLAQRAQPGSIVLLHMPEVGHREWCLLGLQRLLEGLGARGLRAVTVGELADLAGRAAAA